MSNPDDKLMKASTDENALADVLDEGDTIKLDPRGIILDIIINAAGKDENN